MEFDLRGNEGVEHNRKKQVTPENMHALCEFFSYWKTLDHSAYQVILQQNFLIHLYHIYMVFSVQYIIYSNFICYVLIQKNLFLTMDCCTVISFCLPKPSSLRKEGRWG